MVEVKFIIELVVIIASLALIIYIFWTNYHSISTQFFSWLSSFGSASSLS